MIGRVLWFVGEVAALEGGLAFLSLGLLDMSQAMRVAAGDGSGYSLGVRMMFTLWRRVFIDLNLILWGGTCAIGSLVQLIIS
jgi:hypothetical protein